MRLMRLRLMRLMRRLRLNQRTLKPRCGRATYS
jgi:hypothetical protein